MNKTSECGAMIRCFAIGAVAFGLLHAQFILLWHTVYESSAWPGYAQAMRQGLIRPWFTESPRAAWVTAVVLVGVGFFIHRTQKERRLASVVAGYVGVLAAASLLVLANPDAVQSNLFPLGFLLVQPAALGLPYLVGCAASFLWKRT